jgi:1-deoxy-D-xylulose-5-phosphate synthase
VLREGDAATIFAIGSEVWPALQAAEVLAKENINVTVINGRFIKPLDDELVAKYCQPNSNIITVEEGSLAGGYGAAIMERCEQLGIRDVRFHRIGIPDEYVHHGAQDVLRAQHDLHAEGIAKRVREFVGEQRATIGQVAKIWIDAGNQIPEEDLIRRHEKGKDSDHIDEFVYGKKKRATAK